MRRTFTAILAGMLFLPARTAADKPTAPKEQLEALKKEVQKGWTEYYQAYEKAKTEKELQALSDKHHKQIKAAARRSLVLARKHPKDPVAVDALSWIIGGGLGWLGAGAEIEASFDLLQKDYVASDKLQRVCEVAIVYDNVSTKPEQFLRAVLEKNPHKDAKGVACYNLGRVLRSQSIWAKRMRDPVYAKALEADWKADVVKHLKASDPDKLLQEAEELIERAGSNYGNVKYGRRTLGELAKATLFEMHHLVIGKTAPEIEGEDIDGKRFKLSDYRGKIVVLDFWGNW